jgi:hypothetical protein
MICLSIHLPAAITHSCVHLFTHPSPTVFIHLSHSHLAYYSLIHLHSFSKRFVSTHPSASLGKESDLLPTCPQGPLVCEWVRGTRKAMRGKQEIDLLPRVASMALET